jgi:hypothetical protein
LKYSLVVVLPENWLILPNFGILGELGSTVLPKKLSEPCINYSPSLSFAGIE